MKPQPGDISIVDKTGTFLLWYDTAKLVVGQFQLKLAHYRKIMHLDSSQVP